MRLSACANCCMQRGLLMSVSVATKCDRWVIIVLLFRSLFPLSVLFLPLSFSNTQPHSRTHFLFHSNISHRRCALFMEYGVCALAIARELSPVYLLLAYPMLARTFTITHTYVYARNVREHTLYCVRMCMLVHYSHRQFMYRSVFVFVSHRTQVLLCIIFFVAVRIHYSNEKLKTNHYDSAPPRESRLDHYDWIKACLLNYTIIFLGINWVNSTPLERMMCLKEIFDKSAIALGTIFRFHWIFFLFTPKHNTQVADERINRLYECFFRILFIWSA